MTFSGCAVKPWISSGSRGVSPGRTQYPWPAAKRWPGSISSSDPSTERQTVRGHPTVSQDTMFIRCASGLVRSELGDQDDRDVVCPARVDRKLHHVGGGAERVGQCLGQRKSR